MEDLRQYVEKLPDRHAVAGRCSSWFSGAGRAKSNSSARNLHPFGGDRAIRSLRLDFHKAGVYP